VSRLTTTPLQFVPGPSIGTAITTTLTGASQPVWSAWVEFIASASADVQLAGLAIRYSLNGSAEFEIGVGAVGDEVPVAEFPLYGRNAGLPILTLNQFAIPVDRVPAGSRVSVRVRSNQAMTYHVSLAYFEDLDGGHETVGKLRNYPRLETSADTGVAVTPNATPFAWSSWYEAAPGFDENIDLVGVLQDQAESTSASDCEWEIGLGAAGLEVAATSVRVLGRIQASNPTSYFGYSLPVPANTEVTPQVLRRLLFYNEEPECPTVDAGDDQTLTYPDVATLTGSVSGGTGCPDDATYAWTQVSGPDTADILTPTALETDIEFPVAGTYVFQLAATNCVCTATSSVTLTVEAANPDEPPDPEEPNRTMRRLRRAPHLSNDGNRITFDKFQLDLETGLGIATGQGEDPQIMLRWSDDGGQTWSSEHWVSAGPQGSYKTRAIWRKLGQARDRVFEVTMTDPIPWRLLNAWIDVRMGRS
jgi:hypothetical protein